MSIKTRIQLKRDTTANWNAARGFIPLQGEIIIYLDGRSKVENGETIYYPTIKIGDGKAYVQDLPFVEEDTRNMVIDHINDHIAHVTQSNRTFWDNKVNIDDLYEMVNGELDGETLVFTRS